jgi:hypothetical protein
MASASGTTVPAIARLVAAHEDTVRGRPTPRTRPHPQPASATLGQAQTEGRLNTQDDRRTS